MQVRGNFVYLLASLLGFLAFLAIITEYPQLGGWRLISIAFEVSLIVAIWSLVRKRTWFVVGMVLIVIGAMGVVAHFWTQALWTNVISLMVSFCFYLMTTLIAFQELFRPSPIDLNKIMGSVCIYLLAGLNWALLYYFEELLHPGAFAGLDTSSVEEMMFNLIYYSYVTLSTLGYGDITPLAPIAKVLAVLEALFGQFYIAILVAIIVGIHVSLRKKALSGGSGSGAKGEKT